MAEATCVFSVYLNEDVPTGRASGVECYILRTGENVLTNNSKTVRNQP